MTGPKEGPRKDIVDADQPQTPAERLVADFGTNPEVMDRVMEALERPGSGLTELPGTTPPPAPKVDLTAPVVTTDREEEELT